MGATGHIRPRLLKSGEKCFQITVEFGRDPTTGQRNRIYKTIKGTKKKAERTMRDMIHDLENQSYIKPLSVTVQSWSNEYYNTYLENHLSESTLRSYRYQIDKYIIPLLGKIMLQDLTTTQIQQWVNNMSKESPVSHKPMSSKSVKNIFLNLQAACEKAVQLDMLKKNPCKNVILPKKAITQADVYDEAEINQLIECAKDTDMELPIMIALSLGLRRGELIALRWENVDFEKGIVHICENRVDGLNGNVVTKEPKSVSGIRDIPLSSSQITMLEKYYNKYLELQKKYDIGKNNDDYVICQKNGKAYKPYSMSKKFREFLKKNNLRHIRLHDLRHTNASVMLSNGISPKVAQQRLGHSDFSTTMNIYSHVMKPFGNGSGRKA